MTPKPKVPLLNLTCREASRLISESLDRQLTRRERCALGIHKLLCGACRQFVRQMTLIRLTLASGAERLRAYASDRTVKLSADRKSQIKRLLAEARRDEGERADSSP
jgi:hypothetical protein